jgi:ClpP class serine protease
LIFGGSVEFLNLFWIVLVVASLYPVIRQRMVESARLRQFRDLEEKRNSRVIALIHHQESMSFLGFRMARYIDIQDSEEIMRAIQLTDPNLPIDLILHTPGGLVLASEQIANALAKHPGKVTVFVPHYAMSGGTLIALAADEIVMDANAVLGPVDPQIGQYPAASILKVLDDKKIDRIDDETLILADISRKAIRQVKETILRLACCQYSKEEAEKLAEELASGKWTHDYPITVDEASSFGLKVSTSMPEEIYRIMNLFPQSGQRRPSVEYVPLPYPYKKPESTRRESK